MKQQSNFDDAKGNLAASNDMEEKGIRTEGAERTTSACTSIGPNITAGVGMGSGLVESPPEASLSSCGISSEETAIVCKEANANSSAASKKGLSRTPDELAEKLNAARGNHQPRFRSSSGQDSAVRSSAMGFHGLGRSTEEQQAKRGVAYPSGRNPVTNTTEAAFAQNQTTQAGFRVVQIEGVSGDILRDILHHAKSLTPFPRGSANAVRAGSSQYLANAPILQETTRQTAHPRSGSSLL
ncbi:hypothetical protein SEMRO_1175_G249140.1 [Seminavis robusta]|uniref:Uncharacterized protein n=1 Tax=Seminavis robusta TaxID=568900 RepID=A0A9N8EGX3_9STRA|nr:hypothetical protein SEMRO_1175_G249140.1 [Seminavis robusta]|eukprot:Sro1175_g249140.1 n/a (240) ;mRNA; f:10002-10721